MTEQCKPYTYDSKTNSITIDGKPATLTGNKVEWDGQGYVELGRAKAGTRWDTLLTHLNSSGLCPQYCTYFTEHLTFLQDGNFMRSSVSSGTGPVVDWAVVPNDSKSNYEIRADGTLLLAFAEGKQRAETVASTRRTMAPMRPMAPAPCWAGTGTSTSGTERSIRGKANAPASDRRGGPFYAVAFDLCSRRRCRSHTVDTERALVTRLRTIADG